MKTLLQLAKAETSKHCRSWLLHYPRSSPGVNGFCWRRPNWTGLALDAHTSPREKGEIKGSIYRRMSSHKVCNETEKDRELRKLRDGAKNVGESTCCVTDWCSGLYWLASAEKTWGCVEMRCRSAGTCRKELRMGLFWLGGDIGKGEELLLQVFVHGEVFTFSSKDH